MTDIVKRLKDVGEDSLVIEVVRDCMEAAEEIEHLRATCAAREKALKGLAALVRENRPIPPQVLKKLLK